MYPTNPRKRLLLPSTSSDILTATSSKRLKNTHSSQLEPAKVTDEVGRLTTRNDNGTRVLVIQRDRAFYIGRNQACDFVLDEVRTSGRHARVYVVVADTGEQLTTLQDTHSTNGTLHNGRLVPRGGTVVLSSGDKIEIAGQVFRYTHTAATPCTPSSDKAFASPSKIGEFLVSPRTLGSGAFSDVYLAFSTKTLKQVACKRLPRSRPAAGGTNKEQKGRDRLTAIQREVEMLKKAKHPNINKIEGVVVGEDAVHIFLQLVSGGDLFSYLVKKGRLDAPEAKFVLYQLLLGLRYLHEEVNVAHRDIKLENIILATSGPFPKVQLADFGQSRSATQSFRSLNGTLQYMAPEQLVAWTRKGGYSGKRADMWSLGIVLALLLTGSHPFEPWSSSPNSPSGQSQGGLSVFGASAAMELDNNPGDLSLCRAVVKGEVALGSSGFGSAKNAARALLLSNLLAHDPATRATALEALESSWISMSRKELEALYEKVVGKG